MDPPRNNTWNRSTDPETIQRTSRQSVTHHDPLQSTLAPSNVQRAQRTPRQPNPSRPATPEPGDLNTRSAATDTHPTRIANRPNYAHSPETSTRSDATEPDTHPTYKSPSGPTDIRRTSPKKKFRQKKYSKKIWSPKFSVAIFF